MNLSTKTFAQLVQDQAAAIQSRASSILDFTTGSVLRSLTEANAAVGLWLQAMALQIMSMTRLATSNGVDVDSWVNDWGLSRLSATVASGAVTFSRFTPQTDVVILVGTQVQTTDGTQIFTVVVDSTNPAWSLSQNGYLLPNAVASVSVPVQSSLGSTGANVAANTLNVIISNIVGVDQVTNPLAFTGGSNAETDKQLRERFVKYIGSLSKSTIAAIQYAITSMQLGMQCTIIENIASDGTYVAGLLTITVDDGTGAPSPGLVDSASAAVANVRAAGINWVVLAPIITNVSVGVVVTTKDGYVHNEVIAIVATTLQNFIKTIALGDGLPFFRLSQLIYDASPGVDKITSLSLNGIAADIIGNPRNVIKLLALTVS